jgi:hypothetical protein
VVAVFAVSAFLATPGALGASYAWEFEAGTYDYGPQLAGGPTTEHSFVLTNTGEAKVERILWGIRWYLGPEGTQPLDEHLFRLETDPPCRTLEPGASCTMMVAFAPVTLGQKYGELQVYTGREGPPEATVALRGQGAAPRAVVAPAALNFGTLEVGQNATQAVTVENQGDLGLDIRNLSLPELISNSTGPFHLAGGSCVEDQEVPPGASCTIGVSFVPTGAGTLQSELSITDDSPGTVQLVALLGTGVWAAAASSSPGGSTPTPSTGAGPRPLVCSKKTHGVLRRGKRVCVKRHHHHRRHRQGRRSIADLLRSASWAQAFEP